MGCDLCDLNNSKEGFIITLCKTCVNVPMIVLREHRAEFTEEEKALIRIMFPLNHIRWEMKKIHDHAHAHIY